MHCLGNSLSKSPSAVGDFRFRAEPENSPAFGRRLRFSDAAPECTSLRKNTEVYISPILGCRHKHVTSLRPSNHPFFLEARGFLECARRFQ
mmetsp:Transcript_9755/g.22408  ORF Transcript_9755/g.22408 Transcript_9755/m.22408 type:complete len:91 (+) Transcript_9755:75-347(+)